MCESCSGGGSRSHACCDAFVALLLTVSVAVYVFLGAFIFERLDRKYKVYPDIKQTDSQEKILQGIWNITIEMPLIMEENWTLLVQEQLRSYEKQLIYNIQRNWDSGAGEKKQHRYVTSLFYCLAIITTIGYGYMAPQSITGKVATMIYATMGVPLMFICVLKLGTFLAAILKCFYSQVCCCMCVRQNQSQMVNNQDNEIITDDGRPYVVLKQIHKVPPSPSPFVESVNPPNQKHLIKTINSTHSHFFGAVTPPVASKILEVAACPQSPFVKVITPPQSPFLKSTTAPQSYFVEAVSPPDNPLYKNTNSLPSLLYEGTTPPQSPFNKGATLPYIPFSEIATSPQSHFLEGNTPPQSPFNDFSTSPQRLLKQTATPPQYQLREAASPPQSLFYEGTTPPQSPCSVGSIPSQSQLKEHTTLPQSQLKEGTMPPYSFYEGTPPQSPFYEDTTPPQSHFYEGTTPTQSPFYEGITPPQSSLYEDTTPPQSQLKEGITPPQSPFYEGITQQQRKLKVDTIPQNQSPFVEPPFKSSQISFVEAIKSSQTSFIGDSNSASLSHFIETNISHPKIEITPKRNPSMESIYANVHIVHEQREEPQHYSSPSDRTRNSIKQDRSSETGESFKVRKKQSTNKNDKIKKIPNRIIISNTLKTETLEVAGPSELFQMQSSHLEQHNTLNQEDNEILSEENSSATFDRHEITVPVVLCLIIFSGYLSAGMIMLRKTADCTFLEGIYFSFLALCSISFGDMVPRGIIHRANELQFGLMCLYLWFGMGLVMMCVILIRQAAHQQWHWIKSDFVKAGNKKQSNIKK